MIYQVVSKQFILFLFTGGTAALVNICSRIFYSTWISFSTSIILAYLTGMVTAFILAKWLVFKQSKNSIRQSALLFSAVNVLAILQTWLISMGLAVYFFPRLGVTEFVDLISHAVGVMVPVFTSYLGHKHFSFR